jgi:hypothetical protein
MTIAVEQLAPKRAFKASRKTWGTGLAVTTGAKWAAGVGAFMVRLQVVGQSKIEARQRAMTVVREFFPNSVKIRVYAETCIFAERHAQGKHHGKQTDTNRYSNRR